MLQLAWFVISYVVAKELADLDLFHPVYYSGTVVLEHSGFLEVFVLHKNIWFNFWTAKWLMI